MKEQDENAELHLKIQVENPRENAPEYTITTVQELFNAVNTENIDRFLIDFEAGLRASIAMRESVEAYMQIAGIKTQECPVLMPEFTWIDDRQ